MSKAIFEIVSSESPSSAEVDWKKCFICQKNDEAEKENLINPGKPFFGKVICFTFLNILIA